jgi:hypothetical protein
MVMDQAAWHRTSDIDGFENIRIIYQPPYSPELNPVEHLWEYIREKNYMRNCIEERNMKKYQMYINGKWCDTSNGETTEVINLATEEAYASLYLLPQMRRHFTDSVINSCHVWRKDRGQRTFT